MITVSIIVPSFNAFYKIGRCLASLRAIEFSVDEYEVIFVDDKSSDGTFELLQKEAKKEINWKVFQLDKNSGSPSKPRNRGLQEAKGEYIFYLDSDDEILQDTLLIHTTHAKKHKACIVRGSLYVNNGHRQFMMNRIQNWDSKASKANKIAEIIAKQSTTTPQLIRRDLLLKHNIDWPEEIKMGEDTIFLSEVLSAASSIEYVDHPTFIYNKMATLSLSTTQSYGEKELRDHLIGWNQVQKNLLTVGVDYFKLRLTVGLQSVLKSLLQRNRWDITEELFFKFSYFIKENSKLIESFNLNERYKGIVNTLLDGNYAAFNLECRPRLLIAGHDFKFIEPIVERLTPYFDVQYDKWSSHTEHNLIESTRLLGWAEVIFCEWMLGNSKWYAEHKKGHQKLIIRVHRQELGTNYADSIDFSKVDAVMAVSVLFFERILERFPNIPREKLRLIPNYIDIDAYKAEWSPNRIFNLAMIGILPSKKNFFESLKILKELRAKDKRYQLFIYGRKPRDLAWLVRNKEEMAYFEACDEFIAKNDLTEAVHFRGHQDLKKALSDDQIGFVLSVSESMLELPGFESFHLAVADGFAGGGVSLIKRWAGCEYIFSRDMILESGSDIVEKILFYSNNIDEFKKDYLSGYNFISKKYNSNIFLKSLLELFQE